MDDTPWKVLAFLLSPDIIYTVLLAYLSMTGGRDEHPHAQATPQEVEVCLEVRRQAAAADRGRCRAQGLHRSQPDQGRPYRIRSLDPGGLDRLPQVTDQGMDAKAVGSDLAQRSGRAVVRSPTSHEVVLAQESGHATL